MEEVVWRHPETIPNELGLEIRVLLKNDAVVLARVAREERYGTHYLRFCDSGSELSIGTVKGWRPLALPITVTPVTGRLPLERWLEEGKALVAALPRQEAELREKYLKTVELLTKIRDRLTSYEGDVNLLTLMGEITAMVVRPEEAKDIVATQRDNVRGIVAKAKELEQERQRASRLHAQLVACGAAARGDQGNARTPITNEEWSPVYQAVADLQKKYMQVCEAKAVGDAALQKAQQDNAAVRERLRQANKERDRYIEERNAIGDALLSATGEKNPGSLQGWLSLLAKLSKSDAPAKPCGWLVRAEHPTQGVFVTSHRGLTERWGTVVPKVYLDQEEANSAAASSTWAEGWVRSVLPVDHHGNTIPSASGEFYDVDWPGIAAAEATEVERLRAEVNRLQSALTEAHEVVDRCADETIPREGWTLAKRIDALDDMTDTVARREIKEDCDRRREETTARLTTVVERIGQAVARLGLGAADDLSVDDPNLGYLTAIEDLHNAVVQARKERELVVRQVHGIPPERWALYDDQGFLTTVPTQAAAEDCARNGPHGRHVVPLYKAPVLRDTAPLIQLCGTALKVLDEARISRGTIWGEALIATLAFLTPKGTNAP